MININDYGQVDIQAGVPAGWKHVVGLRLAPLCRKNEIEHYPAFRGFKKRYGRYLPIVDGLIVPESAFEKLNRLIAERAARAKTPEQKAAAKERRQQKEIAEFVREIKDRFPSIPDDEAQRCAEHTCEIGSGRVGRSRTADDPIVAAVVAHIRHRHTDYHELLAADSDDDYETRQMNREYARYMVAPKISEVITRWQKPR